MATLPDQKFVVLLRVSTHSQGSDGHGVAAQRRDIQIFLDGLDGAPDVIRELVEVESGASASRPVLDEALDLCRQHKASLLVQKVDRITRDLEVLARIVKDPLVTVRVASLPNADNFQIHLFGCLAAQEREFISTRTKAALAAAKERGVQLGNPKIAEMNSSRKRTARKFADKHAPLVWSLHNKGRSNQEIADVLNESGFTTPRNCKFHRSQVSNILKRSPDPAQALGAATN